MALTPDIAASAALATRVNPGQVRQQAKAPAQVPVKSFGKILESLTPEKAEQAGMSPDAVKTLAMQAQNKRFQPGPSEDQKLREACQGFESVFVGQLLKEMRKSIPKDGMLDSKYGDQYVSMFDEELAKTMTKQGGIGLTDFMIRQLASQAEAKKGNQGAGFKPGLATTASDRMPTLAGAAKAAHGLRDSGLKPLPGHDAPVAPDAAASPLQVRSGMVSGLEQAVVPTGKDLSQNTLAGTPSQHLNLPGAQYLQGEDAKLAASGMVQPVSGEVSSEYGWRTDPFTGRRAWHGGVDIAAPEGTPVRSCRDGTVVFAGPRGGYGNLVVVRHDGGMESYYGHNRNVTVTEGQQVKAGQVLAEVGKTGRATGPHLHFEVRVDGETMDPAKLSGAMVAAAQDPRTAVPVL